MENQFHSINDELTLNVVSQSESSQSGLVEDTEATQAFGSVFQFNFTAIDASSTEMGEASFSAIGTSTSEMDEEECAEIIACTPQKATEHDVCSICWSPCALDMMVESVGEETQSTGITMTPVRIPNESSNDKSVPGKKKKALRTKCGHTFHENCLFETKLRKNECPNCRNLLTPISNPLAMVCQEIQPTSFRDAVVHRSTTAREAVRRKLALQQQQRLQLQRSQMSHQVQAQAQ